MIDRFTLLLLIAGCLVFGAIIFLELEPAGSDAVAIAKVATRSEATSAIRREQNPRLDELLATTLARPLFSSTRRPPQSAQAEAATDSDLADARLTGIVTEPGRRIAIFAISGATLMRLLEGEAVSGWRIESITPREVSLSGPSGTKTLQPKLDPNLVPTAGRPPPGNIGGRVPTPPSATATPRFPVPGAAAGAGQPNPAAQINPPGTPPPRPPRLRQQR